MTKLAKEKILSADNEQASLNILNRAIIEVLPDAELRSFSHASDALNEIDAKGFRPDIAFLDIEMPDMTGLELCGSIKTISPATCIIFVTGYSNYALDAFSVHAGGYLMKPVTADMIREELDYSVMQSNTEIYTGNLLRVQCFGNFDVYYKGNPLIFKRSRSKELFAYLIHRRGTACSQENLPPLSSATYRMDVHSKATCRLSHPTCSARLNPAAAET